VYEQIEPDQPGTPARVRSFAHRPDLGAMQTAVADARAAADIVLVSMHWGIHMVRSVLADYQIEVAHAAIDAGADAILGHHPHLLKGVEFYKGKPIFYSLGNFAIEQPHIWDPSITRSASFRNLVGLNPTWRMDQVYTLPPVTRMTGIAKLVHAGGHWDVHFLPAWINDDSSPQMLEASDPLFGDVTALIADSSKEAGLNAEVQIVEDHLVLRAT
jgi:poly-gamma-glutamate synthesis protein (capsule biosynthesis protein)